MNAAAARTRKLRGMMRPPLHALDAHGAFLEVGLQGNGISGVERHLVYELAFVKPRNKYDPTRHAVAPACLQPGADRSAPRLDFHFVAAAHVELRGIVGMDEADGIGK